MCSQQHIPAGVDFLHISSAQADEDLALAKRKPRARNRLFSSHKQWAYIRFGSKSEESPPDDQIQGGVIALDFLVGCTGVHGTVPAVEVGVARVTPQLQPRYYGHVGRKPLHC